MLNIASPTHNGIEWSRGVVFIHFHILSKRSFEQVMGGVDNVLAEKQSWLN